MQFDFTTTPRVIVRPGIMQNPSQWINDFDGKRLFVITDPGLIKSGVVLPAVEALRATGRSLSLYQEVEADPPVDRILAGVAAAREANADLIIGLGGGSSLDTAKLVALLASTPQKLEDIFGIGLAKGPRLPLILIPTTAGTGSEVTPISIVTTPTQEKKGVVSPLLYPDLAILDADLTLDLPPYVTAITGIDAMVHAIEAYTSKLKKNPLADSLAREALGILFKNLPLVLKNGKDREARSAMLVGSMLAGMAFANSPVGAVHALAYPLSGHFHIPHGHSNALVLVPVLEFNEQHAQKEYAELARVLNPALTNSNHAEDARQFIEQISHLVRAMPFAQTLRQMGITVDDIPVLATDAMKVERLLVNNPRAMTFAAAHAIYSNQL